MFNFLSQNVPSDHVHSQINYGVECFNCKTLYKTQMHNKYVLSTLMICGIYL